MKRNRRSLSKGGKRLTVLGRQADKGNECSLVSLGCQVCIKKQVLKSFQGWLKIGCTAS